MSLPSSVAARRWYLWVMIAAAACYGTFLLEIVLGFPLSPAHSYLSEYAAVDQPMRNLFVAADIASAVLGVSATAYALRRGWGSPWINVLLIAAWASVVVDVVVTPMQCAESLPGCTEADSGFVHMVSSSGVAGLHAVVAILLWRRYPIATSAYLVVSAVVSVLALVGWPVGIAQRTQVALECVVIGLAALATCVQRNRHDRTSMAKD